MLGFNLSFTSLDLGLVLVFVSELILVLGLVLV